MTPSPTTLTVTFVSNYAGNHRVCYRIYGGTTYDCTTIVSCGGGGASCHADIVITVSDIICESVTYEGYVQACCHDEGSLDGRIPFSITYVPDWPCKGYNIKCTEVSVQSVTVTNPGSSYIYATPPAVQFFGGGGINAAATAHVGNGGIKTWTVLTPGSGYNSTAGHADHTFTNVAVVVTGTGIDAYFDVVTVGGVITSINFTTSPIAPGNGFSLTDTFKFLAGDLGGNDGVEQIFQVGTVNTGEIQYIEVTNNGSGYTSKPYVSIDSSEGIQATAEAVLSKCNKFNATECSRESSVDLRLELNQEFTFCSATLPSPGTGYTVTEKGCCYDCRDVSFTPDADTTVYFTDCSDDVIGTESLIEGEETIINCIVNNSWYFYPDVDVTVIVAAPPCTEPH